MKDMINKKYLEVEVIKFRWPIGAVWLSLEDDSKYILYDKAKTENKKIEIWIKLPQDALKDLEK